MRIDRPLIAFVIAALLIQGCGLKRPLRKPDRATPIENPAPAAPAQK